MTNPKKTKCMWANKLDCCRSSSFLTLLICLQCIDNDLGGGDVSRDICISQWVKLT